ncbi:MAG: type II secretion system F family protein, partial [Planctomycetota bacterium]
MKFHYEAYDKMGQQASDVVEAANRAEAEEELRRRGLYVTSLSRGSRGKGAGGKGGAFGRSRRLKNLAIFCRQLYVLVSSGTPVMEALSALERQVSDPSWRRVIHAVRVDVEKGASLQEAMEKHPVYFDSVVRSMVAAGESGGNLVAMLDRLGTLVQSRLHVRKTVIGAMVYPVLLVGLAGAVMAVMLAFVVPRFAGLFEMLEVPLPPSTKVLITASDLIKGWWWAILIVLGGGVMGVKFWLSSPKGRRMVDTVLIRMPQLGTIVKSFAVARIVRLLGVLLDSRVPLIEALQLTRAGLSNSHYVELMTRAEDAVLRG